MKEIKYLDFLTLKDVLNEIEIEGIRIYEISKFGKEDEPIEFEINWSAFGTQNIEKTQEFIVNLQKATNIVEKLNNEQLKINYSNIENIKQKKNT